MTLDDLKSLLRADGLVTIEVHAVDARIYQVFQRFGERLIPLADGGQTARYTSRYAACKALAELGVDQVDFVHRSAYSEMIGTESPFDRTEFRQRIGIAHLRD
jgi:hypothetical protein